MYLIRSRQTLLMILMYKLPVSLHG